MTQEAYFEGFEGSIRMKDVVCQDMARAAYVVWTADADARLLTKVSISLVVFPGCVPGARRASFGEATAVAPS